MSDMIGGYAPDFDFKMLAQGERTLTEIQAQIDDLLRDPYWAQDEDKYRLLGYYVRSKYELIAQQITSAQASRQRQTDTE